MQITLKQDAGKHKAGTHLRVWLEGPIEADHVDPQRAEQWIRDGIAEPRRFERASIGDEAPDPDPGDVTQTVSRKRAPRKRGK